MTKRPLECSQCRKKATISYQEIVDDATTYTEMCAECPALKARLGTSGTVNSSEIGGMCCVHCHTSLDDVLQTSRLGCSNCYAIFHQSLAEIALKMGLTPPFHKGRSDYRHASISKRITYLTRDLNQALKKENYEEAARLRDQIQSLTSRPNAD